MAITNASTLAEYASGISTQGATLTVDKNNKRVGIGTTNPQAMLQVGTGVTVFGNAGIASFTSLKLSGETDSTSVSTGALTVTGGVGIGLSLTVGGDVSVGGTITYEDVTNVDSIGIVTARSGLRVVGGGVTCVGVATFFNDIQVADKIIHTGDTDTAIRFSDADTIQFETGGSQRVRVSAAGSFGIGNLSSGLDCELVVKGAAHTAFKVKSANEGTRAFIQTVQDSDIRIGSETAHPVSFYQGGNQRMQIDASGRLLLGTTTEGAGTYAETFTIADSTHCGMTIRSATNGVGSIYFSDGTSGDSEYRGYVEYHHNGDYLKIATAANERLRITSAGLVGIGTTNPTQELSLHATDFCGLVIKSDRTTSTDQIGGIQFQNQAVGVATAVMNALVDGTMLFKTAGEERLRINSSGYIGIGAANPTYALMIQGAGNAPAGMYLYNDTGAEGIKIVPESNGNCRIYASTNDALCLGTNDTDRITIDADGGNTTFTGTITIPTWLVHSGDSNTYFGFEGPDTITATTAGNERLRIDSSGDIGIGNDSPTAWGTGIPTIEIKGTSGSYVDRSGAIMFESQSGSHGYGGIWGDHGNLNFYAGATNRASASYRAMLSREGAVIVGGATTQASDAVTLMPDGEVTAAGFYFSNNIGSAMNDTGIRRATTNTMVFDTDSKERIRVNADGYVGIGTNSYGTIDPNSTLELGKYTPTTDVTTHNTLKGASQLILHSSNNVNQSKSGIMFTGALHPTDGCSAGIVATHENVSENSEATSLAFYTSNSETLARRVTIHTDGGFGVGTTNKSTYNDNGASSSGLSYNGGSKYTSVARVDGTPFFINRMSGDGNLVAMYESGASVGTISVSGNTVSYNAFLGAHKGRLSDGSKPTILPGTIVENINQTIEWKTATISNVGSASSTVVIPYYGVKTSGTDTVSYGGASYTGTVGFSSNYQPTGDNKHVCVKVSDTASSKAVAGVFVDWDGNASDAKDNHLDEPYNDLRVGGVGNFFIRMKSGETVANGDLVESNGDGTGKVQSDDIIRSKTVGKITSTNVIKTYSDGSFLVTAVLYAG